MAAGSIATKVKLPTESRSDQVWKNRFSITSAEPRNLQDQDDIDHPDILKLSVYIQRTFEEKNYASTRPRRDPCASGSAD